MVMIALTERVRIGLRGGQMGRLAGAGQRQAGNDLPSYDAADPARLEALRGGLEISAKLCSQAEAEIGRSGRRFAEQSRPETAHSRARQLVPPPSTPSKSTFVIHLEPPSSPYPNSACAASIKNQLRSK